ncbi:MAG: hypothetical protein EZS28_028528 [Streblomastix strix]|uniref:Uncharacterized protein n=1 Tax=Streblomastix strix TaxID=222440 RepID=A0A5J4V1J3_9EUKA|nr:MAG: hypothetical protein EZS28_028528 [Streblomastix strix]
MTSQLCSAILRLTEAKDWGDSCDARLSGLHQALAPVNILHSFEQAGQQRLVKSVGKVYCKINKDSFKAIIEQKQAEKSLLKYVPNRITRNYKPREFEFLNKSQLDEQLCLGWFQ